MQLQLWEVKLCFLWVQVHLLCNKKTGKVTPAWWCCFPQLSTSWSRMKPRLPQHRHLWASSETARTLRLQLAACCRKLAHRQANLSAQTQLPINLVNFAASTWSGTQDTFIYLAGDYFFFLPFLRLISRSHLNTVHVLLKWWQVWLKIAISLDWWM